MQDAQFQSQLGAGRAPVPRNRPDLQEPSPDPFFRIVSSRPWLVGPEMRECGVFGGGKGGLESHC
jgi:hypothetical protein